MEEVLTIPKKMADLGDLVIIPKSEYEEYLKLRQAIRLVVPTKSERKRIEMGRREIKQGRYLTLSELKNALANYRKRKR